jgi:hypothetical protein
LVVISDDPLVFEHSINLSPEVAQERGGIVIVVRDDFWRTMTMVVGIVAGAVADRMRVVEADETFSVRPVEGERVVKSVWFGGVAGYAGYGETHPVVAVGVHDEDLTVQVQEGVQRGVTGERHVLRLSQSHN